MSEHYGTPGPGFWLDEGWTGALFRCRSTTPGFEEGRIFSWSGCTESEAKWQSHAMHADVLVVVNGKPADG